MKRPSYIKEKVADLLRGAFDAIGIRCNIFAGDFRTPEGAWRRADVYRWQIYVDLFDGSRWARVEVCSWDTLTDCARHGISVDYETRGHFFRLWEAHALQNKGQPND